MSSLSEQVKVLRDMLAEAESRLIAQAEPNTMSFQLWGPCVAETRGGETVIVWRVGNSGHSYCYQINGTVYSVQESGHHVGEVRLKDDIVRIVRPLTEAEIITFQLFGHTISLPLQTCEEQ